MSSIEIRDYKKIPLWKDVSESDWSNWQWQVDNAVTTLDQLEKVVRLTTGEKEKISRDLKYFQMKISPHVTTLLDPDEHDTTIWKQFVPSGKESASINHDLLFDDVNADDRYSPVIGLVHRYPTKVLILTTNYCGSYCRYCFRRKFVNEKDIHITQKDIDDICRYVSKRKKINEVIFSGGEPLVLEDVFFDVALKKIKAIPHVGIVRIHTRLPVTIPYRITDDLIEVLAKYKPIYFVIHIDTLEEITDQMRDAIAKLVDNGIPCLASCPLLKGINDSEEALINLWTELVKMRVKPYYLFQSDPVKGLEHLMVPLSRGIELMRNVYDNMSGLAMPLYCFNVPDGGGHALVNSSFIKENKKGVYEITTFEGEKVIYRDIAEKKS